MAKQKLGPNQKKWLAALESGKFQQTMGRLEHDGKNCCLGVACRVIGIKSRKLPGGDVVFDGQIAHLPAMAKRRLAMRSFLGSIDSPEVPSLTYMNDSGKWSFGRIAAYCRRYPHKVFTAPR